MELWGLEAVTWTESTDHFWRKERESEAMQYDGESSVTFCGQVNASMGDGHEEASKIRRGECGIVAFCHPAKLTSIYENERMSSGA